MVRNRDVNLLKVVVDTINSWNNGQTAHVHRTNVIVDKNEWRKPYTGYAQPASIVDGFVTYDPTLCKHARTDRVYFVDLNAGLMAWGPREFIQRHVSGSTMRFNAQNNPNFKITPIKQNASASKAAGNRVNTSAPTDQISKEAKSIKKTINSIWVTFEKEGVHKYPAALTDPKLATGGWDDVSFLGYPHRHMFKFKVTIEVFHDDRDIEFIQFKRWLERLYSDGTLQLDFRSCEMISDELAAKIAEKFPGRKIVIEVAEDGENGSYAAYVPE